MQALLGLFFFSVLFTTGTTLQCEFCTSFDTSCTGNKTNCSAGLNTCATFLFDKDDGEKTITTIFKGCFNNFACERLKSVIGTHISGIVYRKVECSKAPPPAASLLLALSGLLLVKIILE